MRVNIHLPSDPAAATTAAAKAEAAGFDGVTTAEVSHDPFLPLALAATATSSVRLQTAIAVAFARTPMALAYVAHDLHALSGGRFVLGLGSQTKPHITRRFSMPWSQPLPRMREYVEMLRAIWRDWDDGLPLRRTGRFYEHTLMTDTFRPPPSPSGPPPIALAAVGAGMTALAGELVDELIPHGFSTELYFREVTLPALEKGLSRVNRAREDFVVHCPGFVAVRDPRVPVEEQLRGLRRQIAFYGSTPAYRPVLDLHGWGPLHERLHELSVSKDPARWQVMGDLITDDVLQAFCVTGSLDEVVAGVRKRYGDVVDCVTITPPGDYEPSTVRRTLDGLRQPTDRER